MPTLESEAARIFLEALEDHEPSRRDAFVHEAASGHPELLQRVCVLLKAHDQSNPMLQPGELLATADYTEPIERPGTMIGPYKLLEQIGEGGMGVVYLAEQRQPVRRLVALKVIKPGMDTKQVIARFEAERQALAMMNHPNIAKVFDGGTTGGTTSEPGALLTERQTVVGRPYFVMELVKGVPITEFCDQQRLDTRERLRLFITVCQAVQHAHQKGLIHRDLKPSNLLVEMHDVIPVPKVIDFGVSKAIGQQLTDLTLHTGFTQMVGTPLYMSPEQAGQSSMDVDTRSDVYSLGVLLYEMLTGHTPFESETLRKAGYDEMRRMIREVDPPRPSARISTLEANALSTISDRRKLEPHKLSQTLRGELDWIVMRALEKDRSRRYETASAFAADVERYLNDEPVEACPPSTGYRLRKYVRRNRVALVTTGLVAASLFTGAGVSAWQAIAARSERDRATAAEARAIEEATIAEAVTDFFQKDVFRQVDGIVQVMDGFKPEAHLTVKQALDRAAARIGDRFKDKPKIEGSIRNSMGVSYTSLGEPKLAIIQLERAIALATSAYGPDHETTLTATGNLATAYLAADRTKEAIQLYERVVTKMTAARGPADLKVIGFTASLGDAMAAARRPADAIVLLERAAETARTELGVGHERTTATSAVLARLYQETDRGQDAVVLLRRLRDEQKELLGPRHLQTLLTTVNLAAAVLLTKNEPPVGTEDEWGTLVEEAYLGFDATLGPDHPATLKAMADLAEVYIWKKEDDGKQGLQLFERALKGMTDQLGPDHPDTLMVAYQAALYSRGNKELNAKVVTLVTRDVERLRVTLGPAHSRTIETMILLGQLHHDGSPAAAVPVFEQVLEILKSKGPTDSETLRAVMALGGTYKTLRQWDKVADLYEVWLDDFRRLLGTNDSRMTYFLKTYAEAAQRVGRPPEVVIRPYEQVLEGLRAQPKPNQAEILATLAELGELQQTAGQFNRAIAAFEEGHQRRSALDGRDSPGALAALLRLAEAYDAGAEWGKAATAAEKVLAARRLKPGRDHPDTLDAMRRLGGYYRQAGRWADEQSLAKEVMEITVTKYGPDHRETFVAESSVIANRVFGGHIREAIPAYESLLGREKSKLALDDPLLIQTRSNLGSAYHRDGRHADAERVLRDVVERRKKNNAAAGGMANDMAALGEALLALGRPVDAEPAFREALMLLEKNKVPEWLRWRAKNLIGAALAGQGKAAEAEVLLLEGYEGLKRNEAKIPAPWQPHFRTAGEHVVRFYESTGAHEKAKLWREKLSQK